MLNAQIRDLGKEIQMSDTPSKFTVVDRRKFTMEGDLRNEVEQEQAPTETTAAPSKKEQPQEKPATPPPSSNAGPRLVTMPAPEPDEEEIQEEGTHLPEAPSAEESNKQKSEYDKSSADLEKMIRSANPGMPASEQIGFEHLVQQLYLSAMMQMGAGTPEGERPRVDILGARQTIDLMSILSEKTKGNLTDREERMVQSALFELRMNFMELTNMISKSATQPPPGGKR
jgi:uncharacterized protein DUF1844